MESKFNLRIKNCPANPAVVSTAPFYDSVIGEALPLTNGKMKNTSIAIDEIKRFTLYLTLLRLMRMRGRTDVSLGSVSAETGISLSLVEEDFVMNNLCMAGQKAFQINGLMDAIEEILGYRNETESFLVGAGKLGTSLLLKENLGQTDLKIVAAFDNDYRKIGNQIGSIKVMSPDKIIPLAGRMHVCLGIIATPSGEAQHIADILVAAGMKAIWNFTYDDIETDENIIVENTHPGQDIAKGYHNLISMLRSKNNNL
jgi:redox-sensing transcriptional repressor